MQNFRALGAPSPDLRAILRLGALPPDPKKSPTIANFWLRVGIQIGNFILKNRHKMF